MKQVVCVLANARPEMWIGRACEDDEGHRVVTTYAGYNAYPGECPFCPVFAPSSSVSSAPAGGAIMLVSASLRVLVVRLLFFVLLLDVILKHVV
jgi:hypothetical protein